MASLPLHAAGMYDGLDEQFRTYNYVVSSYTPTLGAMILKPRTSTDSLKAFLLSVNRRTFRVLVLETNALPNALGKVALNWWRDEQATADNVLRGMKTHSAIHFACHAHQDRGDPIRSAFKLHDGDLTLSTIMEQPFEHAEFAFLSACQTATGDDKLPDESMHLAAGMLFAGYRTVIGTLWAIQDNKAPLVSEEVYSRLVDADGTTFYTDRASHALHHAIARLRKEVGEKSFATWVSFIHIGI